MNSDDTIFAAASVLTGVERNRYLQQACENDAQRGRVEALLANAETDAHPLREPQPEAIGSTIGPYRILQHLGEGGFGVVYEAEQRVPIDRRVALKVIKPGMDTDSVIARFEAERQALAMMDHPNIAQVFDAGTTQAGLPYFVMELVRGIPVVQFCDEQKYNIRQRLELFLDICSAVNHAHQKGVIHRDLKPPNILVALHGDRAVPKIIDFGIAKATQQRLTDKTLFTRFEQFVGTPLYISPEQAAFSGLDVDTRSDIYALGVILYELVAGVPPFDPQTLLSAGFDEMRRIIREEDPPRPSARVSTLNGAARITVGRNLRAHPSKLGGVLRGDLDWIVMKALEKDRTRRYETANSFALDIGHFLNHEPVSAAAPSAVYRFRKFAQRNKGRVAAAGAVILALVAAITASTWQTVQASRQTQEADRALRQLQTTAPAFISQAEDLALEQRFTEAIEKVDHALSLRPQNADFLTARANLLQSQLQIEDAREAYRAALAAAPDHAAAATNLKRCEDLLASRAENGGELPAEALESLFNAMRAQGRSIGEVMSLGKQIGRDRDVQREYWLARLRYLPVTPDKPLSERLTTNEDGELELNLSHTSVSDLAAIKDAPLRGLSLVGCNSLESLEPLRGSHLKELNLVETFVSDLSPLATLTQLTALRLESIPITSLEPLRGLPLRDLKLVRLAELQDLSPLQEIPLQTLWVSHCPIRSFAVLTDIPLEELVLETVPKNEFAFLSGLRLKSLQILSPGFTDLRVLEGMPLQILGLNGCRNVDGFHVLSKFNSLEILALPRDSITLPLEEQLAIDAFARHPSLREISDRHPGKILSLESELSTAEFWQRWQAAREMTNLLHERNIEFTLRLDSSGFHFSCNRNAAFDDLSIVPFRELGITDLVAYGSGISSLAKLEGLDMWRVVVSGSAVSDLSPLQGMKSLKYLGIQGMPQLTDIAPVKGLDLTRLHMADTAVTDLSPLLGMSRLRSLTLPDTATNLEILDELPALQRVQFKACGSDGPQTSVEEFLAMRSLLEALETGDWKEAHERYLQLGVEAAQSGKRNWRGTFRPLLRTSAVLAQGENERPFKNFCRVALDSLEDSDDPGNQLRTARAALIRRLPGSELLAKRARALMVKTYAQEDLSPWDHLVMALAEYRIGHFETADEILGKAVDDGAEHFTILAHLLRCLVTHQLGDHSGAAELLAEIEPRVHKLRTELPKAIRRDWDGWHDRLISLAYLEEARTLIAVPQDPLDAP